MRTKTIAIRVEEKDLKVMIKIFPKLRGESKAKYLKRYVAELKRMQLNGVKYA